MVRREIKDQNKSAAALKWPRRPNGRSPFLAPEERWHVATGEAQSDAPTGAARPRRTERNPWIASPPSNFSSISLNQPRQGRRNRRSAPCVNTIVGMSRLLRPSGAGCSKMHFTTGSAAPGQAGLRFTRGYMPSPLWGEDYALPLIQRDFAFYPSISRVQAIIQRPISP